MSVQRRRHVSGFTLIEVLVGLAILGIMSGLLMSAVFSLAMGANSGVARLDQLDSDRLVASFLRRQIESARPAAIPTDNRNQIVFSGAAHRVQFVGHLPAHRGGGGLSLLSLFIEPTTLPGTLILASHDDWTSSDGIPSESDPAWARRELVQDVDELRFSYFGDPNASGSRRWLDEWSDSDRLPELVRLEIRAAGRSWPTMVIAIRNRDTRNQPQLIVKPSRGQV